MRGEFPAWAALSALAFYRVNGFSVRRHLAFSREIPVENAWTIGCSASDRLARAASKQCSAFAAPRRLRPTIS
jgi:hypothetical protein